MQADQSNQTIPGSRHEPDKPLWTKSFIALTACFFLLFFNLQMLLSSFSSYAKDQFLASDLQASLVTSVFALAAIATRFLTAPLMRLVSRSFLLVTGLLVATVTTALYSAPDSYGVFLALRIVYGIGFGLASTILPTLVSQIIPSRRMGEGIGYFGLSTSLAMSIGPVIGLNVMKQAGFGTLTLVGAAVAALVLPILRFSRSGSERVRSAPSIAATAKPLSSKPGFNRRLLFPALLNFILSITYSGLLSYLALFGDFVHIEQVGLFFLFNAVTIILIRPVSGKLFDRRGHMTVLLPAGVCVAISMLLLSQATSMPILIASALIYGLGFGAIQPTIQAWMLHSSAQEQYGTANSLFYNSTDFGVAIGAIVLGAISSATNYAVMYLYSAGFMAMFVLLGAVQHLAARKREREHELNKAEGLSMS
ncbi:MFS transporter [Paenibacillus sp. LHD-117]|uniref:MFS transporter n=1 Tax=Paenibacillus sp. LHD-117 TaxID=3071412 RepID=UPI0027E10A8E|nr:MFS transporter [Paenibacillus sp. LHD-117]MDQ6423443.1 MFS transporter [Paenibacillus sp. LHD-117]